MWFDAQKQARFEFGAELDLEFIVQSRASRVTCGDSDVEGIASKAHPLVFLGDHFQKRRCPEHTVCAMCV